MWDGPRPPPSWLKHEQKKGCKSAQNLCLKSFFITHFPWAVIKKKKKDYKNFNNILQQEFGLFRESVSGLFKHFLEMSAHLRKFEMIKLRYQLNGRQ